MRWQGNPGERSAAHAGAPDGRGAARREMAVAGLSGPGRARGHSRSAGNNALQPHRGGQTPRYHLSRLALPHGAAGDQRTAPMIADANGRVDAARYIASGNCDERPPGEAITLLVIHNISLPPGKFGGDGVERLFTNRLDCAAHPYYATLAGMRVSAHFLI